ncbi:ATP-binding protein [uncultured Sulfitobacter sp.]|uniref:ATP-binding protein n=1 Tax=uncultured Sulfitobacter sp. TaxID=191468 RepID=UPI00344C9495
MKTDLVILDELGYPPFSTSKRRAAVPAFEQALRAHQCDPHTQSRLQRMCEGVRGAKITTARLDRLPYRYHIPETDNDSYRFKARSEIAKQKRKEKPPSSTS